MRSGEARYTWGDAVDSHRANCAGCTSAVSTQPTVVGLLAANGFGLHDMNGNVAEWVDDCFLPDYHTAPDDGSAKQFLRSTCLRRVVRGGSWRSSPSEIRSAARDWFHPDTRNERIGFRIARVLD